MLLLALSLKVTAILPQSVNRTPSSRGRSPAAEALRWMRLALIWSPLIDLDDRGVELDLDDDALGDECGYVQRGVRGIDAFEELCMCVDRVAPFGIGRQEDARARDVLSTPPPSSRTAAIARLNASRVCSYVPGWNAEPSASVAVVPLTAIASPTLAGPACVVVRRLLEGASRSANVSSRCPSHRGWCVDADQLFSSNFVLLAFAK